MPYIFRCDYCGEEQDVDEMDMDLACQDCGQEICDSCSNHGFCDDCWEEHDDDDD